jgi:hypothetical protein
VVRERNWYAPLENLVLCLCGFLVSSTRKREEEYGRDRLYEVPLRACPGCREALQDEAALKAALSRVELYRRLLAKYPKARVYAVMQ